MEYINEIKVKEIIEQYDSIVIYRHTDPDYDAIGSSTGLKHLILDNYPDKKVYLYGLQTIDNPGFVEKMDNPNEEVIRNSLTISLDTSTAARSDDNSFSLGKASLKIDHHLNSEQCVDYGYVDAEADSACLLVTRIGIQNSWKFTKDSAKFLFAGILTDTCSLTIGSVTAETFRACAKLLETGIDIVAINRAIFDQEINKYQAETYFRNKIIFDGNFAYYMAEAEDREKFGLDNHQAKHLIDLLSQIKGVDKYAAYSHKDDGRWTASLRSHGPAIVQIANRYGGGGHKLAAGIGDMSYEDVLESIQLMREANEE